MYESSAMSLKPLILCGFVVCMAAASSVHGATSDESKPAPDAAQVKLWIKQLSDNDYAVREAASAKLMECGPSVLDALVSVASHKDAEPLWRAVHIVQQIAISGDIDLVERSMEVLEKMRKAASETHGPVLGASATELREKFRQHAYQQIVQKGGVISPSHLGTGLGIELGAAFKGDDKILRYFKVLGPVTFIRLTGPKFSDSSLKQLEQLDSLQLLHLTETKATSAGQKAIEKSIDGVKVLRFGPAVIGVAGVTHSGRCLIQSVQPNTGAATGGLQPGDMITKIDDTEIKSFEELVEVVAEKKVGQEVKVAVMRSGAPSNHTVTLTRRPPAGQQSIPQVIPPGRMILPE